MQIFYFLLQTTCWDVRCQPMLNFDGPLGMALEQNQTPQILDGFCRRYCDAND
jgi:hypothetical protein